MNNDPYHYGAESRGQVCMYSSSIKLRKYYGFKERTLGKTVHYGRQIWGFFINLKTKLYKPMPENMDINNIKQLFPNLEEELYDEMMKHATLKEVKAGDTLLRVGQPIRSIMLILDGIVKLYREDDEGKDFFIYQLNPGQACSLSFVCATRQETSEVLAKALTDATVLSIPLDYMDKWLSTYKSWYQFVIGSYRDRFEELLKTIDAIAFARLDERLEFYLEKQVKNLGNPLKITHQDIANDLNSSREVISRLLKKMEAKKWLIINRNSIEWIKKE